MTMVMTLTTNINAGFYENFYHYDKINCITI